MEPLKKNASLIKVYVLVHSCSAHVEELPKHQEWETLYLWNFSMKQEYGTYSEEKSLCYFLYLLWILISVIKIYRCSFLFCLIAWLFDQMKSLTNVLNQFKSFSILENWIITHGQIL